MLLSMTLVLFWKIKIRLTSTISSFESTGGITGEISFIPLIEPVRSREMPSNLSGHQTRTRQWNNSRMSRTPSQTCRTERCACSFESITQTSIRLGNKADWLTKKNKMFVVRCTAELRRATRQDSCAYDSPCVGRTAVLKSFDYVYLNRIWMKKANGDVYAYFTRQEAVVFFAILNCRWMVSTVGFHAVDVL